MIVFDLRCANGHRFEGWFQDGRAFEEQREKGLVTCPVCDDTEVSKAPSCFAIRSSSSAASASAPDGEGRELSPQQLAALGQRVDSFLRNNFDDVGADFTTEALKIHYGAAEPRNIRGVSTPSQEKMLKEEGVTFFKFPVSTPPESDA